MSDSAHGSCSCRYTTSESGTVLQELCADTSTDPSALSADVLVHRLFTDQVRRDPFAVALAQGDRCVSYAELDARANALAHTLVESGVGAESPVGLLSGNSPEMVVGLLATLKVGGAYVPLDPALPSDRIALISDDVGMRVILTEERFAGRLSGFGGDVVPLDGPEAGAERADAPPGTVLPSHLAYVLYTSGSTGRPKGVAVEHAGIANYVRWAAAEFSDGRPVNSVLHSSLGFDFSFTSLYVPLVTGGLLRLPPRDYANEDLADLLRARNTDLVRLTPSHVEVLTALVDGPLGGPGPRVLVVGGEILRARHVDALRRLFPETVIYNHYGPTETVVGRCFQRLDEQGGFDPAEYGAEDPLPVGGPLPNTRIAVEYTRGRDPGRDEAGDIGELVIGGAGIARGYVGLPQTAGSGFSTIPELGGRIYRTGDLVRLDARHRPVVVGRVDAQVKIRGHRVEPGEIEALLLTFDGVRAGAVVKSRPPREVLAAFVVPHTGRRLDTTGLRAALSAALPPFMVPQEIRLLDELPLSVRGKLDRDALRDLLRGEPVPDPEPERDATDVPSPDDALTVTMCALWERVLGIENVRPTDNFLDLGGDSITAMKLAAMCRREGISVRSVRFLTTSSLAEMCRTAEQAPAR